MVFLCPSRTCSARERRYFWCYPWCLARANGSLFIVHAGRVCAQSSMKYSGERASVGARGFDCTEMLKFSNIMCINCFSATFPSTCLVRPNKTAAIDIDSSNFFCRFLFGGDIWVAVQLAKCEPMFNFGANGGKSVTGKYTFGMSCSRNHPFAQSGLNLRDALFSHPRCQNTFLIWTNRRRFVDRQRALSASLGWLSRPDVWKNSDGNKKIFTPTGKITEFAHQNRTSTLPREWPHSERIVVLVSMVRHHVLEIANNTYIKRQNFPYKSMDSSDWVHWHPWLLDFSCVRQRTSARMAARKVSFVWMRWKTVSLSRKMQFYHTREHGRRVRTAASIKSNDRHVQYSIQSAISRIHCAELLIRTFSGSRFVSVIRISRVWSVPKCKLLRVVM